MRHSDVRTQLDTAFGNVESALRNLSDRLDDVLPEYGHRRGRRSRISRAGRAIRRTATSVTGRVTPHHGSSLVEDTRRTVREHPVGTVLTAAVAGFCVWSVLRRANSRHALSTGNGRTLAGRYRAAQEEGVMRH